GGNINALVVRRLSGLPVAPQITSVPSSTTVVAGANVQFTVGANGTALVYQWQRAPIGSGSFVNVADANASGTNTARLTLSGVTSGNVADYRVIVSNGGGSVTSSPAATLNVNSSVTLAHRWSFSETSGTTAADSIGGANGTLQGNAILGGGFVTLPNNGAADDSSYVSIPGGLLNNMSAVSVQCWVTNNGWNNGNTFVGFGGDTDPSGSGTNFISFFARWFSAISSFQIQTTAGDSGIVALGTRVNYNSATTPPSPAHYAYTYDPNVGSVILYTNGVLSGSASGVNIPLNTLGTTLGTIGMAVWNTNFAASIPNTSGNRPFIRAGFSEVRIHNGALSSNAIVDAFTLGPDQVPAAPQITSQPSSASVFAGATAQFTVGATGAPLNYQWQIAAVGSSVFTNASNSGNVSGATTSQLTVTNVSSVNVADYRVIVRNGSGSVTSSPPARLSLASGTTLIHRWNFNETNGTTAVDSIGGANGTLQGNAVLGGGFVRLPNTGSATDSSYVRIPGGLLNNLAAVSIECWVTNNGWANGNTFVGFGGPTDPSGSGTNFISFFARWFNAISAFQIQTTAGDSGIVDLGTRVNYNSATTGPTPAHYAFLYNPADGSVALYTNGVLSRAATGVTIPLSTLGTDLGTIGRAVWNTNFAASIPNTSGNRPFMNAGFSEVRIYNGVLNTNAIAASSLLGPDQLLSNTASLSATGSPGNLLLTWPLVNGGFALETSPVLGTGAVWTPVNGTKSVVGTNYQISVSTTNAAAFFRLRQ
ncbi:MAG: hypothetical protein H7Y43_02295, partial [Akkermansiaceae bacterium]|nr:hypothetical protein [Verrucomicrobiales bacterium]